VYNNHLQNLNIPALFKKKNSLLSDKNHTHTATLISTLMRKGGKKKLTLMFASIFKTLFTFIQSHELFTNDLKNYLEIYRHNFVANKNLFLINFFIKDIFALLNPAFNVKLKLVNKKKRKKTKKKYTSTINYVFPEKRKGVVFKWLGLYSNYFLDKTTKTRILKSIFYTYVERRQSFLYLKKLEIYSQFIKSKKKKSNN